MVCNVYLLLETPPSYSNAVGELHEPLFTVTVTHLCVIQLLMGVQETAKNQEHADTFLKEDTFQRVKGRFVVF